MNEKEKKKNNSILGEMEIEKREQKKRKTRKKLLFRDRKSIGFANKISARIKAILPNQR